jgi:hypothetical protein
MINKNNFSLLLVAKSIKNLPSLSHLFTSISINNRLNLTSFIQNIKFSPRTASNMNLTTFLIAILPLASSIRAAAVPTPAAELRPDLVLHVTNAGLGKRQTTTCVDFCNGPYGGGGVVS